MLEDHLDAHGGRAAAEFFDLGITLGETPTDNIRVDDWQEAVESAQGKLYLWAEAIHYNEWPIGPMLDRIEPLDPRLGSTLYWALAGAINSWARVWDHTDTQELIEFEQEVWDEEDEEDGASGYPHAGWKAPEGVTAAAYAGEELEAALARCPDAWTVQTVRDAVALRERADAARRPAPEEAWTAFWESELANPLPCLVAFREVHDATHAIFEQHTNHFHETGAAPCWFAELDPASHESVLAAFAQIAEMTATLAGARALIERTSAPPTFDPAPSPESPCAPS